MIDSMVTGTVKRPSADLRRPRGRPALSTHPPSPADNMNNGWLEQPAENTRHPGPESGEAQARLAVARTSEGDGEERRPG